MNTDFAILCHLFPKHVSMCNDVLFHLAVRPSAWPYANPNVEFISAAIQNNIYQMSYITTSDCKGFQLCKFNNNEDFFSAKRGVM